MGIKWNILNLHKQEMLYICFSSIFAMVWFVGVLPFVVGVLGENFAVMQFLLFNIGLYVFLFIFLKIKIEDVKYNLKTSLGWMFLVIGLDIWMPPYAVTFDGVLQTGSSLGVSASDYIIGLLWKTIGIGGPALYVITYVIFPIIFLIVAAKLLPNFLKKL